MIKLQAKSPCAGLLPISIGDVALKEVDPGVMTSFAPFKGADKAFGAALKAAHGVAAPLPNRSTGKEGARAIWFGQRMVLLMGPVPDNGLVKHAALVDQSDAWAVVRLEGQGARDVLARLTPIDLREAVFKRGHTARTELQHMMASITRIGADSYQIMVFRAFAETLVHDLKTAMEGVAAR
ncbi:sarcosine oxidase subunit gamma [Roseovarius sp. 2305UL8-3]|uniref:sarcosine oxidase subunit gamma n=1 Tax=Roseovarius conchicola TaxID=3121636 RepID=UPI003529BEF2